MLTIKAPAKINLTFEVLRRLPDGFHEVRSVLQAIDLCDTLYIEAGSGVSFACDLPDWSSEKSLVSRVIKLLSENEAKGAAIKIEKRIPLLAGLGGDSSDAAALLKGLNDFWQLRLTEAKLYAMAAQLGSDVAFFLKGGTALAEGRGEVITPLPSLSKMWLVLVMPDIPVVEGKTARMYGALKNSSFSNGDVTAQMVETLKMGKAIGSESLHNAFENVALDVYPRLTRYISGFIRSSIPAHLAGAGPTLFAVFPEKAEAEDFLKICQSHRVTACIAATI